MTSDPCIITVAITGSLPTKAHNPAVPITVAEQLDSTLEAHEAGASLVHVHVRDELGRPSSDPERFRQFLEGMRRHRPEMIVQFSTGGRGRDPGERGSALHLGPDMASLATGSVNFPDAVYENPPRLVDELARRMLELEVKPEVEVFDLAMLYNALALVERGLLVEPLHVQFVLGLKNALPARPAVLDFLVSELKALAPTATWTAAGMGRHQLEANLWTLDRGGHCRTGLEDNVHFDHTRLAASNAELVRRLAQAIEARGRRVATPAEARRILGLPAAGAGASTRDGLPPGER